MDSLPTIVRVVPLHTNVSDDGLINISMVSGEEEYYTIDISEGMNDPFLSHTHTNVLNIHTYMHDEEQNMKQINESPFCFFAQRR